MVGLVFGRVTIVNPVLKARVSEELHTYAQRPSDERPHFTSPALNGLALLANDPRLRVDYFIPGGADEPGIFPMVHPHAAAALFDLPDGNGALVSNDLVPVFPTSRRFRVLDHIFSRFDLELFSPFQGSRHRSHDALDRADDLHASETLGEGDLSRLKTALASSHPQSSQHQPNRAPLIQALVYSDPAKTPFFSQR